MRRAFDRIIYRRKGLNSGRKHQEWVRMFDLIHRVLVWSVLHDLYSLQKEIGTIANYLCKSRDGKTPKGVGVDQAPETFDGREKR